MVERGLLDEAKKLYDKGVLATKTASQAIAYKEFLPYFENGADLEECVEVLKRNSRRYAKRQLTWFRRDDEIKWIYRDGMSFEEVFAQAKKYVLDYLEGGVV